MSVTAPSLCEHGDRPGECFACRAAVWTGPKGLTASDLRFSVVYEAEVPEDWGKQEPPAIPGVTWTSYGDAKCETDDDYHAWKYGAAMNIEAFCALVGPFTYDGQSMGIFSPEGLPDWAPSAVVFRDGDTGVWATAWPKTSPVDQHLHDAWNDILFLFSGKRLEPERPTTREED